LVWLVGYWLVCLFGLLVCLLVVVSLLFIAHLPVCQFGSVNIIVVVGHQPVCLADGFTHWLASVVIGSLVSLLAWLAWRYLFA
jgi:hypothetical protein